MRRIATTLVVIALALLGSAPVASAAAEWTGGIGTDGVEIGGTGTDGIEVG